MAESVAQMIIAKEELVLKPDGNSKTAYCHYSYCPSSITICRKTIEDRMYYYISHIPHLHQSAIYPSDPSQLPPFLQMVLSTHSGLSYLNQCYSPHPSTILQSILQSKRNTFIDECKESLCSSAVNEFGPAILDDVVKMSDEIDGRSFQTNQNHHHSNW